MQNKASGNYHVPLALPTTEYENRRKKCDEVKPQCGRCLSSGKSCSYDYVEHPATDDHRVKRTKPAPRSAPGLLAKTTQNILYVPPNGNPTSSLMTSIPGAQALFTHLSALEPWNDKVPLHSNLLAHPSPPPNSSLPSPPLSDIDLTNASSVTLDLVPLSAGLVPPASGSTSTQLAILDDSDPEEIRIILHMTLTLDKNVKGNTLPFVLHCYSQWAAMSVFEPLKVIHALRGQITARFSSENTRTRSILIANVMDMFAKTLAIDSARKALLSCMVTEVQQSGTAFIASPPSFIPAVDRQNAIRILDNMIELVGLQLSTHPTSASLQLLESAAPVFRRACLEPPGKPINLPNLLLDLSLNLRQYATVDIIFSVVTGRPTHFQYEVSFSLELCDRVYRCQLEGNYGVQWLYGLPDQYLLLFVWINNMSEAPSDNDNAELVSQIERQLPEIKIAMDHSGDPSLRIGRIAVLESWRYAVLIYLYMVLGKTHANDPRVVQAHRSYMRVVKGMKPGRNPDAFLLISMIVVGVATVKERDQVILRRRIMNVGEGKKRGTAPNDNMLILEDIWARTRSEGRAAVWEDLRIACSKVIGR